MKKIFIVFGLILAIAACDSNTSTSQKEKYYESPGDDSISAAAMSAATRQSDVDTTGFNVGSNRSVGGAALNDIEKGASLISLSDCTGCHKINQKLVGPAYEAVAEKYAPTEENISYLAGKIKNGGKGVWGEIPMNAHPALSQEEARQLAQYILSLKK